MIACLFSPLKKIIREDRELRPNKKVQKVASRPASGVVRTFADKFALIRIRMKRQSQPFIHKSVARRSDKREREREMEEWWEDKVDLNLRLRRANRSPMCLVLS